MYVFMKSLGICIYCVMSSIINVIISSGQATGYTIPDIRNHPNRHQEHSQAINFASRKLCEHFWCLQSLWGGHDMMYKEIFRLSLQYRVVPNTRYHQVTKYNYRIIQRPDDKIAWWHNFRGPENWVTRSLSFKGTVHKISLYWQLKKNFRHYSMPWSFCDG